MMCDCDFILETQEGWEEHYANCSSLLKPGQKSFKNPDGSIRLQNPNLSPGEIDHLYHLAIDTGSTDMQKTFGDVKFVVMGGTEHRMEQFARYLSDELAIEADFKNLTADSHRYAMYKVGPVLSVSHGIGIPSMSILLQETIKLLSYAHCVQPLVIRLGTSGGLAVPPGSAVVSLYAVNGELEKTYNLPILGKVQKFPSLFDTRLAHELASMAEPGDGFQTFLGGTFVADDFYRGQARLDGPFCSHSIAEKMSFLRKLSSMGVKNIEMEATAFSALTREAGVRAADICVTYLDRLHGDQVTTNSKLLLEYQYRPMKIVTRYIKKYLDAVKL